MKKRWISFAMLVCFCFALFGAGCQEVPAQEEAVTPWAPPVQGLRWGMSMDEALEALACEEYETSEQEEMMSVTLSGDFPTGYGVDLNKVTLRFYTTDSGIPGYDGLVAVDGLVAAENAKALREQLNETYADYRKTDDSTDPGRWESDAMYQLDNASQLEQALQTAFTGALGEEMNVEALVMAAMGAPTVTYSLYTEGDMAGLISAAGKYQVLREAVEE